MFRHHFSLGRALRLTSILLCLLLLLTACSGSNPPAETPSDTETEPSTRPPEAESDTGSSTLSSYEALIIQLQQTLLEERENHYISEAEYRTRLEQLEAELRALKASQNAGTATDTNTNDTSNDASNDIPTGTTPDTGSENTFSFSYSVENGTATIREYLGGATSVAIPATVNGYPVTAIADNAFKNSAITSVTIPSTVTDIGWFAFYGCVSLASVTIPDSVAVIHYAAFDACPKLTILCSQNSYAARFVASFGLRCEFI